MRAYFTGDSPNSYPATLWMGPHPFRRRNFEKNAKWHEHVAQAHLKREPDGVRCVFLDENSNAVKNYVVLSKINRKIIFANAVLFLCIFFLISEGWIFYGERRNSRQKTCAISQKSKNFLPKISIVLFLRFDWLIDEAIDWLIGRAVDGWLVDWLIDRSFV